MLSAGLQRTVQLSLKTTKVCVLCLSLILAENTAAYALQAGGVEVRELEVGSVFGSAGGVFLESLEVTQAIQTMSATRQSVNNSVPMIAGKPTIVRAYFYTSTGVTKTIASGQLIGTHTAYPGVTFTVNSLAPASVNVNSTDSLTAKRHDINKSLNFNIKTPDDLTIPGILTLRVGSLKDPNGNSMGCVCYTSSPELVTFRSSPPLRLRLVGFRLIRNGTAYSPDYTRDFAAIKSWLRRAYPIATIESALPDIPDFFYDNAAPQMDLWEPGVQNTCLRAIGVIRQIRNADLSAHPTGLLHEEIFRTHYLGVLHDNGTTALANIGPNYVEGCSNVVPLDAPDPTTIGFAPTGPWSWGWDADGSYGDWKAGHEIGHTLGRLHLESAGRNPPPAAPQVVCVVPTSYVDALRPPKEGMVSPEFPNEPEYVGFDAGDSIPLAAGVTFTSQMQPVPGDWNDVTAYCPYRWINQLTYEGIRERLEEENTCLEESGTTVALPPPPPPAPLPSGSSTPPSPYDPTRVPPTLAVPHGPVPPPFRAVRIARGDFLSVVGFVNFKTGKGNIQSVQRLKETVVESPSTKESQVHLRISDKKGNQMDIPIAVRRGTSYSPKSEKATLGLVEAIIPVGPSMPNIAEVVKIEMVLSGKPTSEPFAALAVSANKPVVRSISFQFDARQPKLSWVAEDEDDSKGATLTYTVQLSTDGGVKWQTLAVGLTKPELLMDPKRLQGFQTVKVRVIASDGFNESKERSETIAF